MKTVWTEELHDETCATCGKVYQETGFAQLSRLISREEIKPTCGCGSKGATMTEADMYVLLRSWAKLLAEEWGPPRPVWELALEQRLGRKLTLAEIQPCIRRVM